ncbi:MAG: DUF2723 domain-containing protein [Anaerolineae bacterium]|nr:DUF2723 domain-containing protein [Anaerolineae bacterium]
MSLQQQSSIDHTFPSATGLRLAMSILTGTAFVRLWWDFGPLPALAPLALIAGAGVGYSWKAPRWTVCGLIVYCASPIALPRLAVVVVGLAAAGWLTTLRPDHLPRWLLHLVPGIVALTVYILTLSPGLLPSDGGEFQTVAATWGAAHPPGYPLYTMLAGLFSRLIPIRTFAWRVNVFSALVGASSVSLVSHMVDRETGKVWAGWLSGLLLMVSGSFWMTATQAAVRPFTVLCTALMLDAALDYRRRVKLDQPVKWTLFRFGLTAGLSVTHHGSLLFIGSVFALAIVAADLKAWRKWPVAIGAALIGSLSWLYVLLRQPDILASATPWSAFWEYVLAKGFSSEAFSLASAADLRERWWVVSEIFRLQWPVWVFAVVGVALVVAFIRDRWLAVLITVSVVLHVFVSVTYKAPQPEDYAQPAYLMLALLVGWLLGHVKKMEWSVVLGAITTASILFSFGDGWITMRRLASVEEARETALQTLDQTPEGAEILATWHRITPLWYLQQVEHLRPDVEIEYVVVEAGDESVMDAWMREIEESLAEDPAVVVTQQFPQTYRFLPYTIEDQRISASLPPVSEDAESLADFAPYSLIDDPDNALPETAAAGQSIEMTLTWEIPEPVEFGSLSTFIHIGADGQPPLAQVDLQIQAPVIENSPAQVKVVYPLTIPPTMPPGEWSIFAGAYTPDGSIPAPDGQPRLKIGTLTVAPAEYPLPTQHPLRIRFPGAVLRGWDYDQTRPDAAILYLHWILDGQETLYQVTVSDGADQPLSTADAQADQDGYWTSMHVIPRDIAAGGVQVSMMDRSVDIPAARQDDHYVIFGNLAVLTDWEITDQEDQLDTAFTWLPIGASYDEYAVNLRVQGDGWAQDTNFLPVSGQLPSIKWLYERPVTSRQTLELDTGSASTQVSFSFYDIYTMETVFVGDTKLTEGGTGVNVYP